MWANTTVHDKNPVINHCGKRKVVERLSVVDALHTNEDMNVMATVQLAFSHRVTVPHS